MFYDPASAIDRSALFKYIFVKFNFFISITVKHNKFWIETSLQDVFTSSLGQHVSVFL